MGSVGVENGGKTSVEDVGVGVDEKRALNNSNNKSSSNGRSRGGGSADEDIISMDNSDNHSTGSEVSYGDTSGNSLRDKLFLETNSVPKVLKRRKPKDRFLTQTFLTPDDNSNSSASATAAQSQIYSVYVTSYDNGDDPKTAKVRPEGFSKAIKDVVRNKYHLQKTACGLIASFINEHDLDRVTKLELGKIFGQPVQMIRFQRGDLPYRRFVLVKDVPWCIATAEIRNALKTQNIWAGQIVRNRAQVRIEIFNSCDLDRLTQEGLNFYNCTSFPVALETSTNAHYGEQNIIQCYNCQGFWHTSTHCRYETKCVRCGENHDVENCPRCRNDAICCHCGGPHHAAYKNCPVRLQHLNNVQVAFSLAKNKPRRQYHFLR